MTLRFIMIYPPLENQSLVLFANMGKEWEDFRTISRRSPHSAANLFFLQFPLLPIPSSSSLHLTKPLKTTTLWCVVYMREKKKDPFEGNAM